MHARIINIIKWINKALCLQRHTTKHRERFTNAEGLRPRYDGDFLQIARQGTLAIPRVKSSMVIGDEEMERKKY